MCSFVFQTPRVQEKKVDSYYKHETLTSGSTFRDFKDGSFMFKLSHERLKFLKSNLPINTGSILDIGCNRGEFLSLFKNHEWTRYGIEPSKPAFEIAKKAGLITRRITFDEVNYKDTKFDVISIISVLEHLYSPLKALLKIRGLLKHNGYLFLEVPDLLAKTDGLPELDTFEHLSHFTQDTLHQVLNISGFKIIAVDKHCSVPDIRIVARKTKDYCRSIIKHDHSRIIRKINSEKLRKSLFKRALTYKLKRVFRNTNSKTVGIWGAGQHSLFLNSLIGLHSRNVVFFDSDSNQRNKKFLNKKVYPPSMIKVIKPSKMVISSAAFQDEIFTQLKNYPFPEVKILRLYKKRKD